VKRHLQGIVNIISLRNLEPLFELSMHLPQGKQLATTFHIELHQARLITV